MEEVSFKGIVKYSKVDDCWFAENEKGEYITANVLEGIDCMLDDLNNEILLENDEVEIIVRIKRARQ